MKNSKFFTFIGPVLDFIDDGDFFRRPFRWLYTLIALLNLLFPLALLAYAFGNDLFLFAEGRILFAFLLVCAVVLVLSWFSFQIWWNRRDRVGETSAERDEFVVIPVFSHFVQTVGEWIGMYVGIGGALMSLICSIFLGGDSWLLSEFGIFGLGGIGLAGLVLFPIYGFLIVVVARVLAETYRALAAIANNTRRER